MIGYIFGKIKSITSPFLILLTHGVGYEIYCGSPEKKYQEGDDLELWVHTYVREDQLKLYGFESPGQKSLFLLLNAISGVGPKTAFAIVELFSIEQLADALANNDARALQAVPGIGKKTAERLMLELEGKLTSIKASHPAPEGNTTGRARGIWRDLRDGLVQLGFPEIKINRIINVLKREKTDWTLEKLMEHALRKINS
jgi:Holliday junction DNA helicase RuvA